MICLRTDNLIKNDVEYLPTVNRNESLSYYGFDDLVCSEESEQSYAPIYGKQGFHSHFVFLCFHRIWLFAIANAVTYLFVILSYRFLAVWTSVQCAVCTVVASLGSFVLPNTCIGYLSFAMHILTRFNTYWNTACIFLINALKYFWELFDENIINTSTFVMVIYFVLLLFNLLDIISSLLHYMLPDMRKREVYHRMNTILVIINGFSIIATIVDIILFALKLGNGITTKLVLAIVVLRLHRLVFYFSAITKSPLRQGLIHVGMKYVLMFFILNHAVACVWKLIACFECNDNKGHWNEGLKKNTKPFHLYIMCLYNALDATTTMGIVGGSARNNAEFSLTLVLMYYGVLINTGVFLGAFTSVQVDVNQRRALFGTKLSLIEGQMAYDEISEPLKKKINTWYMNFWKEESAVVSCPIMDLLPTTFIRDIKFDTYFNALKQCHLFRNLHDEVKTSLALKMHTVQYNAGNIILHQKESSNGMLYVARGNVQLVSPDDIESPIITFEYGTVIGSTSLVVNTFIPAHLIATTYCHVYVLNKSDCWRTLAAHYKLKPSGPLFEALEFILNRAKRIQAEKVANRKRGDKTLKLVKNILNQERSQDVTGKVNEGNLMNIYHISKGEKVLRNMDKIFLSNKFPWVLYTNSYFITVWEILVLVVGTVVVITYPYYLVFLIDPPPIYTNFLRPMAYVIFIIDIIIQLFTCVIDDQQVLSSFFEIATYRLAKVKFLFDILSILPFEAINAFTTKNYFYLSCNHMFKLVRVVVKLISLMCSLKYGGKSVRIGFYLICLIYFGYLQGIIYYKSGCPDLPCDKNSWVRHYNDYVSGFNVTIGETTTHILLVSITIGLTLLTGSGGTVTTKQLAEKVAVLTFFLSYMFLYTYLLADYSATLTLDNHLTDNFLTEVANLREFMQVSKMKQITIDRANVYMETIYKLNKGKVMRDLWVDLPLHFTESLNLNKLQPLIEHIPIFQKFSKEMLRTLMGKVKYETYPASEHIVYAGDRTYKMIVIQSGYCEMSRPGLHVKNILGPGDNAGVLEMLHSLPMCHSIKTVTNVNIFYIYDSDFNEVLYLDESWASDLRQVKIETIGLTRVFRSQNMIRTDDQVEIKPKEGNFVVFKAGKLDPVSIDYHRGWGRFAPLRYLLLKRTIRPDSKFLYCYVIFHALVAFYIAIMYPLLFIFDNFISWWAVLLLSIPWDVFCLFDVYLRLHVAYYNNDGLLVSHPRYTAQYYLCHSFAIDFITSLPIKVILTPFLPGNYVAYSLFIKVIRAYRIPNAFAFFRRDILKNPRTFVHIIYYLAISLVLWNTLASGLVAVGVRIEKVSGVLSSISSSDSWIYTKLNSEITLVHGQHSHPFKLYLLSLYYVTGITLQIMLGDVTMIRFSELIYSIITLAFGYIWFNYILVIVSNTKAVLNDNLTKYKNDLHDMCKFMKTLNIPKTIQKRCIRHFQYIYSREQGYRGTHVFDQFHSTLRMDCQMEVYLTTLLASPVFKHVEFNFFQQLCAELNVMYFVEHNTIISINDVVNTVYIINRGHVQVFGPTKNKCEILTKGALFGNLDNAEYIRSMVQVTTITSTDILCLPVVKFYEILENYPEVMKHIKEEWYIHNMYCLPSDQAVDVLELEEKFISLSKLERIIMSNWIKFIYMFMAYCSYFVVLYHMSFLKHNRLIFAITYFFDLLHIIKIYIVFHTPFMSKHGEFVSNAEIIKKKYVRSKPFYIDIIGLIPIEILALAMPSHDVYMYIAFFRANRLIRFLNISWYIKIMHDFLNMNEIMIKMISVCIHLTSYVHFLACIWYTMACPLGKCIPESWIYDGVSNGSKCDGLYLCSLYHVSSLVSSAGYATFPPRRIVEVCVYISTIVISRFVMTLLVAYMAAIVRHFGYRLQTLSAEVSVLKTYFKNCQLSPLLQENVLKYIERLWYRSYAKHMPYFLEIGPPKLIEEIKVYSFGTHIFNNYVFQDCHNDFLRLLTTHVKLVRFFLNDVICKQGEVNNKMYFIHYGEVEVLCVSDQVEVQVDLLTTSDSFGMIQGLFPNTPHSHTFQATQTTDMIMLHLDDWIQILAFYPAAKFHIYNIIKDYNALFKFNNRRITRMRVY